MRGLADFGINAAECATHLYYYHDSFRPFLEPPSIQWRYRYGSSGSWHDLPEDSGWSLPLRDRDGHELELAVDVPHNSICGTAEIEEIFWSPPLVERLRELHWGLRRRSTTLSDWGPAPNARLVFEYVSRTKQLQRLSIGEVRIKDRELSILDGAGHLQEIVFVDCPDLDSLKNLKVALPHVRIRLVHRWIPWPDFELE